MSQEFSFPNLFIGLLRLSSSRAVHDPEAVQDPELIARFIHQMTGNENQYVPPPPAAAAAAAAVPTAVSTPTASLAVAVCDKSAEELRRLRCERFQSSTDSTEPSPSHISNGNDSILSENKSEQQDAAMHDVMDTVDSQIYPDGDITYVMRGEEINQIGWYLIFSLE